MKTRFIKFPLMWQLRLSETQADGCAYRVALHLLDQARWHQPVVLGNVGLRKWGISRNGKRRALQQLRQAGLIKVEERPRKSPIVTVRFAD